MMIMTMSWKGCWNRRSWAEHSWIHTMMMRVPLLSRLIVTLLLDTHLATGGTSSLIICAISHNLLALQRFTPAGPSMQTASHPKCVHSGTDVRTTVLFCLHR